MALYYGRTMKPGMQYRLRGEGKRLLKGEVWKLGVRRYEQLI